VLNSSSVERIIIIIIITIKINRLLSWILGIHVPTRQIRTFSTFNASSALRHVLQEGAPLLQMAFEDLCTFE
jgi:hypothetical protein